MQPDPVGSFRHTPMFPTVISHSPSQHWTDDVQAVPAAKQQMLTPFMLCPHCLPFALSTQQTAAPSSHD